MRITADIIDEELEPGCPICSELLSNPAKQEEEERRKQIIEQRNKVEELEWLLYPPLLRENTLGTNYQEDKYKDMCSKFRNLNISGEDYLEKMPRGPTQCANSHPFDDDDDAAWQRYCRVYGPKDGEFSGTWEWIKSPETKYPLFFKSNFKDLPKMEEMKEPQPSTSKSKSDEETPPAWLAKYLQKMKQEIKDEIMEELTNLPRNDVQGPWNGKIFEQHQGHVFHPGIYCDNCDQLIHGIRYKCGNCADFDLCEECESLPNIHNKSHRFLKIRFPSPVNLQKHKLSSLLLPVSPPCFKSYVPKKLYEAKFVCDETVPDGTDLPPSTRFIKSWRVLNSGKRVWTHSTKLQHIQGSVGLTPASEQVDVPHLRPGEEGIVSVLFTTPAVPGVYRSHWNFCHKSRPFGHIVWCHIIVKDTEPEEKPAENISETLNLSANGLPSEKEKEVASIAKVLTAVKEEHEKGNIIPRKLAVNSHTTTPNNTPFDLTPPKSPDHQAMTELKVVIEDKELASATLPVEYDPEEEEEEGSVVSLSSSDSDAEFVVIPMPNCFNLSESLASHNISHLSQYLQSESVSDPKDLKATGQKLLTSQNILKPVFSAETVSQETGVPELSERSAVQNEVKATIVVHNSGSTDGSSPEISIIASGDSSPTAENAVADFGSIQIAVTSDSKSDACECSKDNMEESGLDVNESLVLPPGGFDPTIIDVVDLQTLEWNTAGIDKVESPDRRNSNQQEIPEKEDETTENIPGSSATFPKFPVEGITSIYEPATSNTEERSVQVLPEKIVSVPLNVASTVYNATRQVVTNLRRYAEPHFVTVQEGASGAATAASNVLNPMDQLIEMGFCNRQQNEELLKKHKNNVALVVGELVNLNDNDWYASRHVPPSAPTTYN